MWASYHTVANDQQFILDIYIRIYQFEEFETHSTYCPLSNANLNH